MQHYSDLITTTMEYCRQYVRLLHAGKLASDVPERNPEHKTYFTPSFVLGQRTSSPSAEKKYSALAISKWLRNDIRENDNKRRAHPVVLAALGALELLELGEITEVQLMQAQAGTALGVQYLLRFVRQKRKERKQQQEVNELFR